MNLWTGIIFVLFLGIVGYLLRDLFLAEGFQGTTKSLITQMQVEDVKFRETAGIPELMSNLEEKRDLFHYAYGPNSLPVDSSILTENPVLTQQLEQATYTPGNPIRISQSILKVGISDDTPSLQVNLDICRQYKNPSEIPVSNPASCGWYLVPDTETTYNESYCVPGNSSGPNDNLMGLPEGGIWYWNKEAAIAAEAKKICKRTTNCKLQINESCAFCEDKGYSIPFNRQTLQPLYGETCTRIRWNPAECPADPTVDSCSSTTDISVRKGCVLKILENHGISKAGLLYRYVNGELNQNEISRMNTLLQVMNTQARWRTELLDMGNLSVNIPLDMSGLNRKIQKIVAAKSSYDSIVSGIARHFVDGTPFDSASYYYQTAQASSDTAQKTLALQDLQQEFRKVGCQASGSAYPTAELLKSTASLAEHRTNFQKLYLDMFNEKDEKQQEAIRKCLNSNLSVQASSSTKGAFCNEPGIEYLIYSPATGTGATLIARFISPVGLLGSSSSFGEAEKLRRILRDSPFADQAQVGFIARTMFSIEEQDKLVSQWILPQFGNYQFRMNGTNIPVGSAGSNAPNISYTANQLNFLEIQYMIDTLDKSLRERWGNPQYPYIFQNLRKFRLLQESFKPFIHFQFSESAKDLNSIVSMQPLKPEIPIQYSPRFTPTAVGAPSMATGATFGLMSPVILTPLIRSSLIQIIDLTVFLTGAGIVFKLIEGDSYIEQFRVQQDALVYEVFNGSQGLTYRSNFPPGFSPYGSSQRFAVVFTKGVPSNPTSFGVSFLYEGGSGGLKTLPISASNTLSGSLGFRRPLKIQLLDVGFRGSLQKFGIYDRKTLRQSSAEGFQNPTDIPEVLQESSLAERIQPESVQTIDQTSYVPKTILGISPPSVSTSVNTDSGTCTFTPKPVSGTSGFQYREEYKYNKIFNNATPISFPNHETKDSLKACYDKCISEPNCVGMNYASDTGSCTYFGSILNDSMSEKPNSVSLIMPGKDKSLTDMRNKVRAAILSYKSIRNIIKESKFRDSTQYKDRTPISDALVNADLAAIENITSIDCLNAFLEKYTFTTK